MSDSKTPLKATFIGGHRKTGTTMLLALLDGHPQLNTFPADSGFFYAYFPPYESDKYTDEERIERIIQFCYGNLEEELDKVGINKQQDFPLHHLHEVFREMASIAGKITTPVILQLMLEAYRKCSKADTSHHIRWVEKTSSSDIYASYIFKWFPDAKFIHLVRDPRDNYASLKSGWKKKYSNRADNVGFLRQSMIERGKLTYELARLNLERYGCDRYMVLKFEDLTADPKKELINIASFLGIDFDESMLKPTVCGSLWDGNNFDGLRFQGPFVGNVNRWRERIDDEEAMLIENYFKDIMDYYGYKRVFNLGNTVDAAVKQYIWYNYNQSYSV